IDGGKYAQQPTWHRQENGHRKEVTFILRRQQKVHYHNTQEKDHSGLVAGLLLLEAHTRPLKVIVNGQNLRGNFLNQFHNSTGTVSCGRRHVDRDRIEQVVPPDNLGAAHFLQRDECVDRHHLALVVLDKDRIKRLYILPVRHI